MRRTIKTLDNLKDSRIMFDREPPPFGYLIIILVVLFLTMTIIWSIRTPKIYTVKAQGVITNENSNYVMATYTGQIEECNLEEGKLVNEGDVLFSVKSTEYDIQEVQIKENRKVYLLQIEQNQKLVKSIKEGKNLFDQSKPEDSFYYSAYENYKSKIEQSKIDVNTYKEYGYTDAQIEAELLKNQKKIDELYYSTIQSAEISIEQANQQIATLEAQLIAIKEGKRNYQVKATATGTLHMLENYKKGMMVQATTAVATITPENAKPVLEAYISTSDMARINKGDSVEIAIDGLSQAVYGIIKGKVSQIDSNITTRQTKDGHSAQSFKVLIDVEENYLVGKNGHTVNIVNGMTAEARIQYNKITYFNYVLEKLGFIAYGSELNNEEARDIEISNYKNELEVGEILTLDAMVIPQNAKNDIIVYSSSNSNIATVNSFGEIKGINKGNVTIVLTCGNISKEIEFNIKVGTEKIMLNEEYIMLKKGENYQIKATVLPDDANQALTYKSINSSIAKVSEEGLVEAVDLGSTIITVSNGDKYEYVHVIVNKLVEYETAIDNNNDNNDNVTYINRKVDFQREELQIVASKTKIISKELLQYLYDTKGLLQVEGEGYYYIIDGNNIVNTHNEMLTDIFLKKDGDSTRFFLNQGKELCGEVTLYIDDFKGEYLYLYSKSKDKYQQIDVTNLKEINLSKSGEYMITTQKIRNDENVIFYTIMALTVALFVIITIFVFSKRRYWFW